jgi:hypothetical protein
LLEPSGKRCFLFIRFKEGITLAKPIILKNDALEELHNALSATDQCPKRKKNKKKKNLTVATLV